MQRQRIQHSAIALTTDAAARCAHVVFGMHLEEADIGLLARMVS